MTRTHSSIQRVLCWALLAFFTAIAHAATPADTKVTIDFKSAPVETVLDAIKQQTGLNFVYSAELAKTWPKVSIEARQKTAEQVIAQLMEMLNCEYAVRGNIVSIGKLNSSKKITLRGRVVDTNGEPLVGVTIKAAGSDTGVITDIDGNYTLTDINPNSNIIYSYVGKLTIERKASAKRGDVIMEDDASLLKDVVVTGYQTISKERATGSFAKVTAEVLKAKRYDNLTQLLEGEVAGYNAKSNLVRGTSTMNGVSQPLYVIDGFPVENTRYTENGSLKEALPDLNVNDIESITVLKDAAAASIYGARAANGVVVIVTKKAKEKRTTISFNTSLTYHPYSFNTKRLTNAADIIALEREWAQNNPKLQDSDAAAYAQSLISNAVYTSQGIRSFAEYYAGNTSQSQMEQTLNSLAAQSYAYYDDIARYAKRDALYQQYHLSVGRASEANNFIASLTYRNNKMNDKHSNDNSWSLDIRDALDVTKWLKLELGAYTSYKKANEQTFDAMNPGYSWMPYDHLRNADGSNFTDKQESRLSEATLDIIKRYGLYRMDITPLDEIGRNISTTNYFVNRTYGKLNLTLPYGLVYNVMFQYEYGNDKTRLLYDKESYYVRNLVNSYATDNGSGGTTFNIPYGNILFRSSQTSKAYTFRQQLNFDKTYKDKHNIVALIGHEVRKTTLDYEHAKLYNYDPEMLTFSLVDQAVLNNTIGLLGGTGIEPRDHAYLRYIDNRFISYYANAAYTFDDKYMLSGSIRWDRSNLWGTSSKYQRKPIWSFGAGWNVDREKWFKISWIDRLKLRASYGIAGNVAKDAAPYMTASYHPNNNVGGIYGTISTRPNPNLRWEKTTTTNIALDFALLKNRIAGSIEYYNKMGTDLLANTMGVPTEGFGYSTYRINNGEMRNRGVEMTLNGNIVRTKDIDLNASATYSYNKNKVVYVNVKAPFYILQLDYPEAYPIIGNPYGAIYAYQWAGLSADGLPQVRNAAGEAVTNNPADLDAITYAGSTAPTGIASFNLAIRYKRFDFSMLWVWQGGHKLRNTDLPMLGSSYNSALWSYVTAIAPVNKDIANRWRQPGDENKTNIPAAIFAESALFSDASYTIYSYADLNVISAANLRLANVSMAWNVPTAWVRKLAFTSARIQLNVENACTFAKSKNAKYLLGGYDAPNYVLGLYIDL